jgi:hypothetical protein
MKKAISIIITTSFTLLILVNISGCKTNTPIIIQEKPQIPPLAKEKIEVFYNVEPEKYITDNFGYIGVEYFTNKQEKEKIKNRLDKKKALQKDYEKAYSRVPEFGNIVLHIGRKDLMHANTKCYSYSVRKGEKVLLNLNGKEGIPNIRGRDGNWWNILKLPVRENIKDTLSVVINDNKTSKIYNFKVLRVESIK